MMKLVRYQEYKNAGVSWLGKIPVHWKVKPLRALLKQRNEKNYPIKTTQILSLSIARGVTLYSHKGRGGNKSKGDLTAYKVTYPGDIVLNSMNVIVGAVGLSKYKGAISPVYYALYPRSDRGNIHYYDKVFSNVVFQRYLSIYGKGILIKKSESGKLNTIRMKISADDLKKIFLPLPPAEEQIEITRFLDWKTSQINRFIRNRQKLIEVLNEQKQAIINRAVTRGLNPDVRLKPSGIDWLGDIPEHWENKRGKYYFREYDVRSETGGEELLSVSHVTGVTPRAQKNVFMFKAKSYRGYKVCKPNDVVINTMWAWMAAIGVSRHHGIISSSYHTYEQIRNGIYHPNYLDYLLRLPVYKEIYTTCSSGITSSRLRLYPEDFLRISFIRPPIDEQKKIAEWIQHSTAGIETGIRKADREISLIREYRTRLISDAVTGKVDVRHLASQGEANEKTLEAIEADEGISEEMLGQENEEFVEDTADADT